MKITTFALAAATLVAFPFSAMAETTLVIGSGGETGTYFPVIQETIDFCGPETGITMTHRFDEEGKSVGGSINNIRGLLDNVIQAGLIQGDTAYLQLQTVPAMQRIQALLAYHLEPIHFIVPATVMVEEGSSGVLGFGGSDPVFGANPLNNVSDLRGHVVATWGGSATSAQVINQLVNLGMTVNTYDNQGEAMAALDSGQAHVVVSTVGFPATWIRDLPSDAYKLLDVLPTTQETVANVYGTTGVSYDNLVNGGRVNALSVQAILFTRTYRTEEMLNALAALQSCVVDHLYEIQDTAGTHPAWQGIPSQEAMTDILWENMFEAPAATPTSTVTVNE